ncbi:toast rack family protein [candidate division KSB1 bacterium]|nr:toast rack family protein [candidate division KSB1 bacterium]
MKQFLYYWLLTCVLWSLACDWPERKPKRHQRVQGFDKVKTLHQSVPFSNEKELHLKLEIPAAKLILNFVAGEKLIDFSGEYSSADTRPEFEYTLEDGVGALTIQSRHQDEHRNIHWDEFKNNEWTLRIHRRIPLKLVIQAGAIDADLDLTYLSLTRLKIEVGAGSIELSCDTLNLVSSELQIQCGAAKFVGNNLCNLNFNFLKYEGGVGASELNFLGKQSGKAEIEINAGVGKNSIYLARHYDVRVRKSDSFLAPISLDDFEEKNGNYFSYGFGKQAGQLDFDIRQGVGHTRFSWID